MKPDATSSRAALISTLLFLAGWAAASQSAREKAGRWQSNDRLSCNAHFMRSYLFKGRQFSDPDRKSLICPNIRQNCCNRFDEQRAYHYVNEILPPRLVDYREKIKSVLYRIKALRKLILARPPVFRGSRQRVAFCMSEYRKMENYGYNLFHDQLLTELQESHETLEEHYAAFTCIICDANSHGHVFTRELATQALIDSKFCLDFLEENQKLLEQMNVELVGILMNFQNVVDCHHFRRNFNLPFFDRQWKERRDETGVCINSIGSKVFILKCKSICDRIYFSKIVDLIEGDFDFLTVSVNLFERYFRQRETGRLVSNDLRSFFKQITKNDSNHPEPTGAVDINFDTYQVGLDFDPRVNLSTTRELTKFTEEENEAMNVKGSRRLRERGQGSRKAAKSTHSQAVEAGQKLPKPTRKRSRPVERRLLDSGVSGSPSSHLATATPAFDAEPKVDQRERILAVSEVSEAARADVKSKAQPETFERANKRQAVPLVYSRELKNKYQMIQVDTKGTERESVFPIQRKPMDLEKAFRTYDYDNGLSSKRYTMNFHQPEREFYFKLFSFQKPEGGNLKLNNFLSDFSSQFRIIGQSYLTDEYRVEPRFWELRKGDERVKNAVESLYLKQ